MREDGEQWEMEIRVLHHGGDGEMCCCECEQTVYRISVREEENSHSSYMPSPHHDVDFEYVGGV